MELGTVSMRVAFVLRSAEVQPMFRRFVWNTLMRSSLQIMYDTDSPPPKSAKGLRPRPSLEPQSWNYHHEEPRISHTVSKDIRVEVWSFSWWFFYHSMFNIQVPFLDTKARLYLEPIIPSWSLVFYDGFFMSPCLISRWLVYCTPDYKLIVNHHIEPRISLMMKSGALDVFFYCPCLISRWLFYSGPGSMCHHLEPRISLKMRSGALDGGFFIAHVWYPGDFFIWTRFYVPPSGAPENSSWRVQELWMVVFLSPIFYIQVTFLFWTLFYSSPSRTPENPSWIFLEPLVSDFFRPYFISRLL